MNKLILIGNGFDLAHRLPTSYGHFLDAYLENILETLKGKNLLNDGCIEINWNPGMSYSKDDLFSKAQFFDLESVRDIVQMNANIRYTEDSQTKQIKNPLTCQVHNEIITSCLNEYWEKNWVDIEQEYYNKLVAIARSGDYEAVDNLNNSLEFITRRLRLYLMSLAPAQYNEEIQFVFNRECSASTPYEQSLIVNFNYTNTPSLYFKSEEQKRGVTNINIHGNLMYDNYPPIFGYGDEMDDNYKILEKLNQNRFLNHIKSIGYLRNESFARLQTFIDQGPFRTVIMGHSCGLSDRVMLNMIFEHNNCISIKPYYHWWGPSQYDDTDFRDLMQNITRHFNKKGDMRKKLVNFLSCKPLPQIKS